MTTEVIALLMPDTDAGSAKATRPVYRALVRRNDGAVVLEDVADTRQFADGRVPLFREAEPIVDPRTRDVIGYELRPVGQLN